MSVNVRVIVILLNTKGLKANIKSVFITPSPLQKKNIYRNLLIPAQLHTLIVTNMGL